MVTVIISSIGLLIGMPFALLMGLIAGLLEFMPSIGHAIWLVLASSMALFLGSTWMPIPNWAFLLVVLTCHIIFTQFDLNYLIPRLIGRSVKLPPVAVILGIVAGAALAGVMGVVLAAPTIASMRVLGRYLYARLADQDPFPEQHAYKTLPPPEARIWKKVSKVQVTSEPQIPPEQTKP
jgi:predicted PurR-regulated permease PerM